MDGNNVKAWMTEKFPRSFLPKPHLINALLVQSRGEFVDIEYSKCEKTQGNFQFCIRVPRILSGGCGNCTAQGTQSRCEARDPPEEEEGEEKKQSVGRGGGEEGERGKRGRRRE